MKSLDVLIIALSFTLLVVCVYVAWKWQKSERHDSDDPKEFDRICRATQKWRWATCVFALLTLAPAGIWCALQVQHHPSFRLFVSGAGVFGVVSLAGSAIWKLVVRSGLVPKGYSWYVPVMLSGVGLVFSMVLTLLLVAAFDPVMREEFLGAVRNAIAK